MAIAAIGGKDIFCSLLNEKHIANEMGKLIKKNKLERLAMASAQQIFREVEDKLNKTKSLNNDPKKRLAQIVKIYPNYVLSLGIYNCFWRYIGNSYKNSGLSASIIRKISKDRDKIAKLYPLIEEDIKKYSQEIGKREKYDGDLLRYFTFAEINNYFKTKKISNKVLKILESRRKQYFYLYTAKHEDVFTKKTLVNKVKNNFFEIKDSNIREIRGFAAFRGKVRGRVYKPQAKNDINDFKNTIIVTSMTKPDDIEYIKKSKAIVTDEGGILSHAAIISRELKKPCVIGTKIATKVLQDGDLVEVDANRGIVKIIK